MVSINVEKDKIVCDEEEAIRYVRVLEGLAYHCKAGGYRMGWRNEIAVNLTVAAYMLGLDPLQVMLDFEHDGLIDPESDDESPYERVERALNYDQDFSWEWMIDADDWEKTGIRYEDKHPIAIVIQ